ncbi:MAG: helix-turn-helix transcriptional regulator [Rhodospirillales bacterium]|nr:helix-turn-helix transcriptional regulator [Rhodospirillales bacterium]
MSRRPTKQRDLSARQKRSADYLSHVIATWISADPTMRVPMSNVDIAAEITRYIVNRAKPITGSALSSWISGRYLPSYENAMAIAAYFGVDPEEALAAFGHKYEPPLTFGRFCDIATAAHAKQHWGDGDWIISQLIVTREWEAPDRNAPWWRQLAWTALYSDTDVYTRAWQIAHLVEAEQELGAKRRARPDDRKRANGP